MLVDKMLNIDVQDTLLIRIALLHYIDWLESEPRFGCLDVMLVNHCKRLINEFDEFVKLNQ